MTVVRLFAAVGLVAWCSCTFDGRVPTDAVVVCSAAGECPTGLKCQPSVGRCVPPEQLDTEPPSLVVTSVVVQLRPRVGNRLTQPSALGPLGEAQVSFTVSEPLASPPRLTSSCGLDCTRARDDFTSFEFSCVVAAQVTEGDCALSVKLVDLALNEAEGALPGVRVDVTAPPPPPTTDADKVVYHRRPHGAVATAGVPEWHVSITDPLTDAVAVVARSGAFDRAQVDLDGGAPGDVPLLALDSASLEVASIDAAGNLSAWAKVLDGRWVASPGASGTSPHRVELVGALGQLTRTDVVTPGAADELASVDGRGASIGGAASWARADLGPSLASRNGAVAVDLGRGRVVLWGGDSLNIFNVVFGGTEKVCEWGSSGTGWACVIGEDPESDGNPEPRSWPVMVYDETRRRVVMHGGRNAIGQLMADTWAWNGKSWQRLAQGPPVEKAAAFWDTARARLVLVGGTADGGATGQRWSFDGLSWSPLPPGGPTPRWGAALAFDRRTGTAWLFGGANEGQLLGDTWRSDGTTWSLVDAGAGPSPRAHGRFAWDFDRGEGLLWGGQQPDGGWTQDAWWWDGARWTQRGDGGLPSFVSGADALAYEPWAHRFVATSGFARNLFESATESWVVKEGRVSVVTTPLSPAPAALRPAMTCRGPLGCLVLNEAGALVRFGEGGFEPAFGDDAGLPSLAGVSHRLAWDSQRARYVATVVNADAGTATWELSADAGAWSWRNRGAPSPQGMYFLADDGNAVICPSANRFENAGLTSAWNGVSWQPVGTVPLLPMGQGYSSVGGIERSGGGFWALLSTFNPFRQVLYAVVDAGTWLPSDGGEAAPIAAGMIAENPQRGRLVAAHGLVRSSTPNASTWERLGPDRWALIPESDPEGDGRPLARVGGVMGWEPRTQSLLALGGSPQIELGYDGEILSDAWRLEVSPHRPASVFRASLAELALEPNAALVSLEVRATAGGDGEVDGGPQPGVSLALWYAGRWETQGVEHGQSVGQPAPLVLRVVDPQRLDNLLTGQPDLNAAVVARGANGSDFAHVFVDAIELEVAYRRAP